MIECAAGSSVYPSFFVAESGARRNLTTHKDITSIVIHSQESSSSSWALLAARADRRMRRATKASTMSNVNLWKCRGGWSPRNMILEKKRHIVAIQGIKNTALQRGAHDSGANPKATSEALAMTSPHPIPMSTLCSMSQRPNLSFRIVPISTNDASMAPHSIKLTRRCHDRFPTVASSIRHGKNKIQIEIHKKKIIR